MSATRMLEILNKTKKAKNDGEDEKPFLDLVDEPQHKTCTDSRDVWLYTEAFYNFCSTLLSTFITNATLITFLGLLEPDILNMSSTAMLISLPLAILFAVCEAYSHLQQSKHFVNAERDLEEANVVEMEDYSPTPYTAAPTISPSLTIKQKLAVAVHYTSDVLEGAALPLVTFSQVLELVMKDIAPIPPWARYAVCVGPLLFSGLGNIREAGNTVTAVHEANLRQGKRR